MTEDTTSAYESATRFSYDAIAETYTSWIANELTAKPYDRALLGAFSELVLATCNPATLEIGCGPGRITTFLAALGLDAQGLDLSPAMIELAAQHYPNLDFTVGSMTSLPYPENSFGGVVAWYSIIHVPDEDLGAVFEETARVLQPGGLFQLAFQLRAGESGARVDHHSELAGIEVDLDSYRRTVPEVLERLEAHGFRPSAQVEREPDGRSQYPEATRQGYVLVELPR